MLPDFAPCELFASNPAEAQIVHRPSQLVCTRSEVAEKASQPLDFPDGMALAIGSSSRGHPHPCLPTPDLSNASPHTVSSFLAQVRSSFSRPCGSPMCARRSTLDRSSN